MIGIENQAGTALEKLISPGGWALIDKPVQRTVKEPRVVTVPVNGVPTELPAIVDIPVTQLEPTKMTYDFIAGLPEEERDAIRAVTVTIDPRPDEGLFSVTENAPEKIEGQWRITFNAVPRDPVGLRASARVTVNTAAENARLRFITPGDGQMLSYREKVDEAKDCVATYGVGNPPPAGKYPVLESEVGIKGVDVLAVAALIIATYQQWKLIEKEINRVRVEALAAIDTADAAGIRQIVAALQFPMPEP